MLSALLLAGLFAAPIATAALFLPAPGRERRAEGYWRWLGRLTLALAWTAGLTAVVAGILALIGVTVRNIEAVAAGLVLASLLWLPFTRRWGARGHVCWAATTYTFVVYLVFMLWWTFASHLGVAGTAGGLLLWLLELFAAALGCAYLWELCDTLGRASWTRRVGTEQLDALPGAPLPFVCLQVPCYNEPPEMVIDTLTSLQRLDYPNYEVQVIDDNTDDEALWRPVELWCRQHGVKFVHLSDWPGFKSGALNYALEHLVEDSCELIGVIDSDYQIDPRFLRQCGPLFADPQVGFIQAPQDYREWEGAPFYRWLYYSYKYFFSVSQPSRNERDGAIFAGTMGLIRRSALEAVGGWAEWCITEDAELSLRLLRAGWSGLHVDRSFGKGIMPLTFEALQGQRFRWCFGGIQILRRYWRSLLPGRQTAENRLSLGQRWAYMTGAIQWYGDLLALLFFVFLLVGAGNIAFGGGLVYRKLTGFLLAAIPLLVVLGLLRAVALLRRGTGASWGEAFGAFAIWQATSLTVARASVQALVAKEAVFLRTPKTHGEAAWIDALKANWLECVFGLLGLAGIGAALAHASSYGGPLLAALLLWPTASFLAAPYNSLSAQRAALPADLRERRRTESRRYGARRLSFAVGGLGVAGVCAAAVLALFVPGPANVTTPQLVGPASGKPVHYGPVAVASSARGSRGASGGGQGGGGGHNPGGMSGSTSSHGPARGSTSSSGSTTATSSTGTTAASGSTSTTSSSGSTSTTSSSGSTSTTSSSGPTSTTSASGSTGSSGSTSTTSSSGTTSTGSTGAKKG
jgi:glycosyltransferase involved in cell wall biosynthesis